MAVLVLDKRKRPLMPCSEKRARVLLERVKGFQTGDLVQARVPTCKKAGTCQGRVAIRATGSFNIQSAQGVVQGISHRHCRLLQSADGYGYTFQPKPLQEDATRAA